MGGSENGEKERAAGSRARGAAGKAKEEEKCGLAEGSLSSDEGKMGGEQGHGKKIPVIPMVVEL